MVDDLQRSGRNMAVGRETGIVEAVGIEHLAIRLIQTIL
jgi:hypothetical protein